MHQPDLYTRSVASHASLVSVRLLHLNYFVSQDKVIWALRLDERKIPADPKFGTGWTVNFMTSVFQLFFL
jgi:hypothetical protein